MYEPYARVRFKLGPTIDGTGTIMGVALDHQPSIGRLYIVKMDDPIAAGVNPGTYPYPCLAVPSHSLSQYEEQ